MSYFDFSFIENTEIIDAISEFSGFFKKKHHVKLNFLYHYKKL